MEATVPRTAEPSPTRSGGRQRRKARLNRQATLGLDWDGVHEAQMKLAAVIGGGDSWPERLEGRLQRARQQHGYG